MGLLEHFGPTVGRLRVARSLSQEKLAHLSGIHATFVGAIERGEKSVTLETLDSLARGLGISPWELIRIAATDESRLELLHATEAGPGTPYGSGSHQLRFSIVAERTSSGYSAYCPDLPGCAASGESREDVERAMQETITAELRSRRQAGSPIPEPASYATVVTIIL